MRLRNYRAHRLCVTHTHLLLVDAFLDALLLGIIYHPWCDIVGNRERETEREGGSEGERELERERNMVLDKEDR